jgi:hypothetical protein
MTVSRLWPRLILAIADFFAEEPLCYQDVTGVLPGYYQSMLWLNQELTASMICGVVFRD